MPHRILRKQSRNRRLPFWILVLSVWLVTTVTSFNLVERDAKEQARKSADETLNVQIESLNGLLNKFRSLPPILSRQQDVINLFRPNFSRDKIRDKLTQLAYFSGARDVALYSLDGGYYASAREVFPTSLRASKDSEQLLIAPTESRLGRATLLFETGDRLYGFSSLVGGVNQPVGIVVFFVDLSTIENAWALSRLPIFVTNQDEQIILSNVAEWRGKYLKDAIVIETASPQVYFENELRDAEPIVKPLTLLEWDMHVLGLTPTLNKTKRYAVLLSFLVTITVALALILFVRRRDAAIQAERLERANALRLERLVQRRTRDLNDSNISLQKEIDERKLAEERLIKAQEEVIRAAKLAAIGQMSATLSHEYNQPLAAIGTYAENAEKFLELQKPDRASENLGFIRQQVERMGALSRTLLGFARKPDSESHPVSLHAVIDESVLLCSPRARKSTVELQIEKPTHPLFVLGGKIRLTQVFVNLITNAIDATASRDDAIVRLRVSESNNQVIVEVADNGSGIDPEIAQQIFEPFFTTKEAGVGLGIGLSIVSDLVREFGGTIAVSDSDLGGASFRVSLERVDQEVSG
jgi:two-component system C4-dicarboxylate transport sensor histidine kinase DctB